VPVIVDSNVIFDVTNDDPVWADWSDAQITAYQPGGLLINPLIYTELCTAAATTADVDKLLAGLKLELRELSREALFLTAKAFLKYRRQGGTKTAPLPDFFIGAHAQVLGVPILTRDAGRYTSYFPSVQLICP
jgi:predicted nucleic acid-binding protein